MSVQFYTVVNALAEAVAASYKAGDLLVAAAGNTDVGPNDFGIVAYPGRYTQVIAVTGVDDADGFADPGIQMPNGQGCAGSRFGDEAELSAPFVVFTLNDDDGTDWHCGTSFAAPAVSGMAALVWSQHPTWTNAQVRNHLQNSVKDLGNPGWDEEFGYGRIDVCDAVACQVSFTLNGPGALETNQTGMWSASSVSGGISPYSYRWYVDGVLRGTSQSFSTSFSNTGTYVVKVRVTPTTGLLREKSMNVTVTGGGGCLFPPCS